MNYEDETPAATPLALDIHERFARKMAPGGEIDRILNGGEPVTKRLAESDEQIALRKRQIETQMAEYEQAVADYSDWFGLWKSRQPKGFRLVRSASPRDAEAEA